MHFGKHWPLPQVFICVIIGEPRKEKKPSRPKGIIKRKENRHHYILTEVILTGARGPL